MKNGKIHGIIHSSVTAASAAGAGMAQIPGSDNTVITPIQIAMIQAIGTVHGVELSEKVALSALSAASAGVIGRTIFQFLIGWWPLWGNAINATTAFSFTESIGWAVNEYFEN